MGDNIAAYYLRGYVIWSPKNSVGLLIGFGEDLRYAKVSHLNIIVFCKEHVGSLQISVMEK